MKLFSQRTVHARALVGAVTTLLVVVGLTVGISESASASTGVNFTVDVTTKAGAPLTGVTVYAVPIVDGHEATDQDEVKATAIKRQAGFYSFTGGSQLLSGASYTLAFLPTGAATSSTFSQYLGGASDVDHAQTFVAGTDKGQITSLNTSLATNAVITGVITGPTGKVVKGAIVDANFYNGSTWYLEAETTTSSKGKYTLTDLEPGSYKLEVYYPGQTHAPVFSGGAATMDDAAGITLGLGSKTTENLRFPSFSGSIKGAAEYNNGANLTYALPAAYPVTASAGQHATAVDDDRVVFGTRVNSRGNWSIAGLAPGAYVVRFFPYYYNEPTNYLAGSGQTTYDVTAAQLVQVASTSVDTGWASTDIISEGGALKVTVVDPTDEPVVGASVLLQRSDATAEYYDGVTNAQGTITLGQSGKHDVIRPGAFELSVVTRDGSLEPYQTSLVLGGWATDRDITLGALTAVPGFSDGPTISQTDTSVGTVYQVAATASRSDAVLSYEWRRDGTPIYGANSSSYTSTIADIGKTLSVRVEASSFGFDDVFASVSTVGVVTANPNAPQVISPPVLSPSDPATIHAGSVLEATPGTWSEPGLDFQYTWTVGDTVASDTSNRYTVNAADVGEPVSVQVTATDPSSSLSGSQIAEQSVIPTEGATPSMVSPPTVVSTTKGVQKGSVKYTASSGTWIGPDPAFAYQWQLGGNDIAGASASTYTEVTSKATGTKPLTVTVTASVPGYTDTSSTTTTARRATTALAVSTEPSTAIEGSTTTLGATASVPAEDTVSISNPGVWAAAGNAVDAKNLTFSYQWYRAIGKAAAKAIAGATSSSYIPPLTSIGYKLSVVETVGSTNWGSAKSSRIPAGTVTPSDFLVDTAPAVTMPSGTIYPNTYITATVDPASWVFSDGVTTTFQWFECAPTVCSSSSPTSDFTAVPNSNSNGITVPQSAAGGWMFLRVSATKAKYAPASEDSAVISIDPGTVLRWSGTPFIDEWYSSTDESVHPIAVGGTSTIDLATIIDQPSSVMTNLAYSDEVQVCSSDCSSPDSSWQTASGTASFGASPSYEPDPADYADGDGWVRVQETARETGFATVVITSVPVKINPGTYTAYHDYSTFKETAGPDPDSDTFTVTPVPIAGVSPTVQWYLGTEELSGLSQVVDSPEQTGVPEYAAVTYDIPGYLPLTYDYVARYLPYPPSSPTNSATIIGNRYGQQLALSTPNPLGLTDYPGAPWGIEYEWCLSQLGYPSTCFGSATPTYSLANPENIGYPVSAKIIYSSPLWPSGTSETTTVAMDGDLLPGQFTDLASPPQLSWQGDLNPGVKVSVALPDVVPFYDETEFEWQTSVDGATWTTVQGGVENRDPSLTTANSYTPTIADIGKRLRVVERTSDSENSFTPLVETSDAQTIGRGIVIAEYAAPVMTGTAEVGSTLSVDPGAWESDATVHIQWMLDDSPVPGATTATYVPLPSSVGDEISVRVTASRAGVADVSDESDRKTITEASAPTQLTPSKITGKGTASSPLTVSTGSWSVGGLQYTYQWFDGDTAISGATTNSLVLPPGDLAADVHVTIIAKLSGYEDATVTVP